MPGESDADLKKKIVTTTLSKSSSGTIPELIKIIKAFDPVNTYTINENPPSDFQRWDGQDLLSGYFSLSAKTKATLHIEREVECKGVYIDYIGPIVGVSVGPGTISVYYVGQEVTVIGD